MIVGIVIQARMGSSRLPGKVLMDVGGKPLLEFLYSRLQPLVEKYSVFVATTLNDADDVIVSRCVRHGIAYFRGSEIDVLDRFYQLSTQNNLDIIVRLNADCPFLDAKFVDDKIQKFLKSNQVYDYGSTIIEPTYPIGMHVEIMTYEALCNAYNKCSDPIFREHVTPYIYKNPQKFALKAFRNDEDLSNIRLTVDYKEDLIFTNELIKILRSNKRSITFDNVVSAVQRSRKLQSYNQHIFKSQTLN